MLRRRQGQVSTNLLSAVVVVMAIIGAMTGAPRGAQARAGAEQAAVRRVYSLAAAIKRFRRRAPELVAARRRARVLSSASGLAARFTNPSLDYDQELVFPLATQEVVRLRLPIPLGGRFARRREVARSRARLARAKVAQLSAVGGVSLAKKYFELLALHRLRKLRRRSLAEHRDLAKRITARAQGGGLAGIIATRLELEVRSRRFALERLGERLNQLGRKLALLIGDRQSILVPKGGLLPPTTPSSLNALRAKLRTNSTRRHLRLTLDVRRAEARLTQARRWPDLGLSLGYIRQQSARPDRSVSHGLVFGLSVPLPLFSSNRRAVRIAQLRSQTAAWRIKVVSQNNVVLLRDAHGRSARARKRYARYQARVLKRLPTLLRGVRVAFDGGGALSTILESLGAVDKMREGGLRLALGARVRALRLHELAGTLPTR